MDKCYRLQKDKYSFIIKVDEKCSKFKVYYEYVYKNDIGRRFGRIMKFRTYDSYEDMQADFGGFLDFIQYDEEAELDEDDRYFRIETTTRNDKGRFS